MERAFETHPGDLRRLGAAEHGDQIPHGSTALRARHRRGGTATSIELLQPRPRQGAARRLWRAAPRHRARPAYPAGDRPRGDGSRGEGRRRRDRDRRRRPSAPARPRALGRGDHGRRSRSHGAVLPLEDARRARRAPGRVPAGGAQAGRARTARRRRADRQAPARPLTIRAMRAVLFASVLVSIAALRQLRSPISACGHDSFYPPHDKLRVVSDSPAQRVDTRGDRQDHRLTRGIRHAGFRAGLAHGLWHWADYPLSVSPQDRRVPGERCQRRVRGLEGGARRHCDRGCVCQARDSSEPGSRADQRRVRRRLEPNRSAMERRFKRAGTSPTPRAPHSSMAWLGSSAPPTSLRSRSPSCTSGYPLRRLL